MVLRLNQVTVAVTDVERAAAFYGGLGLVPIVVSGHYRRFVLPAGGATFSLHRSDQAPLSTTTVYFECDDLDATVAQLERDGYAFDHGPVDQVWNWREARLRDPDGNPICLYQAGDQRLDPPWRVRNPESDAAVARARGGDDQRRAR